MANEKRLIDAKELERQVKEAFKDNPYAMGQMLRWIRKQPTVDAVEVVRCFSCMHWHEVEEMEGGGYCNHPRFHVDNAEPPIMQAADYCSYGERK